MTKTLGSALILLVLAGAIFTYRTYMSAHVEPSLVSTTDGINTTPAAPVQPIVTPKKSATSTDTFMHFKCDGDHMFKVEFPQVQGGHAIAGIVLGTNGAEFFLPQSTSSPHLYEGSSTSFYVEGDNATLQVQKEKYDNCTVAK